MTTVTHSFLKVLTWTPDECRAFIEAQRWPNGPVCPRCGVTNPSVVTRRSATKNVVKKLYSCRACRRQFTVTVGTIFEDSHIPLNKWLATIMLMCASKKGISAHQIHRMVGIHYRSAWYMCHRIREAMGEKTFMPLAGIVEADSTFVGGKPRGHMVRTMTVEEEVAAGVRHPDGSKKPGPLKGQPHPRSRKAPVFGMVERGGNVRTMVLAGKDESASEVRPILLENLAPNVHLITDMGGAYRAIKRYVKHDAVNHDVEYVSADNPLVHTQTIESHWALLKRGMIGTFHHVNRGYLPMYLSEFEYRWNSRQTSDSERFAALLTRVDGRLAWRAKKQA